MMEPSWYPDYPTMSREIPELEDVDAQRPEVRHRGGALQLRHHLRSFWQARAKLSRKPAPQASTIFYVPGRV